MSTQDPAGTDTSKLARTIEVLSGRIAKVTALVAAVGTLVIVTFDNLEKITKKVNELFASAEPSSASVSSSGKPAPASSCLTVRQVQFPTRVGYSDELNGWDQDYRVEVSGTDACDKVVGLYMTIKATSNVFVFDPPGLGPAPCEKPSNLVYDCWDYLIPVTRNADNTWNWSAPLPSPQPKNDAAIKKGTISITYSIRRTDQPDLPIHAAPVPVISVFDVD